MRLPSYLLTADARAVAGWMIGAILVGPFPAVPGWADERPTLSYEDGTTRLRFGQGEVNLSNRLQFRWTETDEESDDAAVGIPRARTKLDGWLLSESLTYELQVDFADFGEGERPIQDLYLNWDLSKRESLQLQVGQFKVPFGRQRLTSSGRQQFVDRSIVSKEFTEGRDVGVQVWGLLARSRVEYRVGAFGGNGRFWEGPANGRPQWNARVMFQPWGQTKYSESDFESKDRPLLALGANVERKDLHGTTEDDDLRWTTLGADLTLKHRGLSVFAELFLRSVAPETGPAFLSPGRHFQAGYFLVRDRFEVAARYASWDPNDSAPVDGRREIGVGANYFHNKRALAVQTDVRRIENAEDGSRHHEFRFQMQAAF